MTELIPPIRNAARALIVRRSQVLLLRKAGGGSGERYALPGGGQDLGETLQQALVRECQEEIGTTVAVGGLLHVAEFFKLRDTQPPTRRHLVEFLFSASVADDYTPRNGHRPDKHQLEVVWIELDRLAQIPLFPPYLANCIPTAPRTGGDVYLGTFHDHAAAEEH